MASSLGPTDDALAYLAIVRLHAAYADVITRRAWPELHEQFRPDATVTLHLGVGEPKTVVGPQQVGEFIAAAIDRFEFFEFVVLNSVVSVSDDGTSATGRMYMQELRQDEASGRWTTIYGVYDDTYTQLDGRWRFAKRDYHSLARPSRDMVVFPIPGRR